MKKTKKIFISLILVFIFGILPLSHSEEENRSIKTLSGSVTAVDWVGSRLVIGNEEFEVSPKVKVLKGTNDAGFTDIKIGDKVRVRYYETQSGDFEITEINVDWKSEF